MQTIIFGQVRLYYDIYILRKRKNNLKKITTNSVKMIDYLILRRVL